MNVSTAGWILAAGLGTSLGGLALLLLGRPTDRVLDTLLGFTAGIMLAATAFSLLVPALYLGSMVEVVAGFIAGAAVSPSSTSRYHTCTCA